MTYQNEGKQKSYIYFIRHGQTEGTMKDWYYGAADLPLAEEGVIETVRLKEEGLYPDPEDAQFFVSGLSRTMHTLKLIYGDVEYTIIPELQEMNFGDYECIPFKDLDDDERFLEWCNDTTGDYRLPGAETKNEFAERIGRGLTILRKQHGLKEISHRHSKKDARSIVVFHGGAIAACMTLMFPEKNYTIWDWSPEPGHGYKVTFEDGEPTEYERF